MQGIRCSYLLTCVCMLRYSAHYAVPMLFYFFTFSVVHFWQGVCMLRYSVRYAMPMLFYFFTFSVIHFWQDVCILRYSAHYALRSLALNLSLPPLAVPSPTEVPQPPLPPSHPAQRRWPNPSRAATPISHNRDSHPKPQHHNIHTIRYNSKTSSV